MQKSFLKIEAMKIFTEFGITRLEWDLNKLDNETLNWKITPEANSVRWLLTHISLILNVYLPRAFTSNLNYLPENWSDNYQDNDILSIEKILADIENGKKIAIDGFNKLSSNSLEEQLDWYIGESKRESYLMILVSEILHHERQIAAILGLKERISDKKTKMNPQTRAY